MKILVFAWHYFCLIISSEIRMPCICILLDSLSQWRLSYFMIITWKMVKMKRSFFILYSFASYNNIVFLFCTITIFISEVSRKALHFSSGKKEPQYNILTPKLILSYLHSWVICIVVFWILKTVLVTHF